MLKFRKSDIRDSIIRFCTFHPAVLPSLFFFLGLSYAFTHRISLTIPFCTLLCLRYRWIPCLCLCAIGFVYGSYKAPTTFLSFSAEKEGVAKIRILDIQEKHTYRGKKWQAKVHVRSFLQEGEQSAKNLLAFMQIPSLEALEHSSYLLTAILQKKGSHYILIPRLDLPWQGKGWSLCIPKLRMQAQQYLATKIRSLYPSPLPCKFLLALTLGQLEDPLLRSTFNKLGLQHILAISGFHFAILSASLTLFLYLLFPKKIALYVLLCLLTLYFFLLSPAPSVLRAYLGTLLYLGATAAGIRSYPINILATTLTLELLLSPGSVTSLGFQLSFLATAAILFFVSLIRPWIEHVLPKRSPQEAIELPWIEKPLYIFGCLLRPILTVNCAVLWILLPATLYYFSAFPLGGLLYNLFVPLCVTISLLLFLTGIFFFAIPFVAEGIHSCNALFTGKVLDMLLYAPSRLDASLHISHFPVAFLYLYLLTIFAIASYQRGKKIPCPSLYYS